MSIKINLTGEQVVQGNMRDGLQTYKIYYYPKEVNYIDKIWLYFNRKEGDKLLGIKSLCFSSTDQHRKFILNNLFSHLYLLEKRSEDYMPQTIEIEVYRKRLLDAVLFDLRKKIIERWKKESQEIKLTSYR